MTAITNNYSAKPKYFFKHEINKRTKRGKLDPLIKKGRLAHPTTSEVTLRKKKFGNVLSAKRFIKKNYGLAIDSIRVKHGFEICAEGSWEENVFTIWLKKKSKSGDKTLNSNYEVIFRLCKCEEVNENGVIKYRRV